MLRYPRAWLALLCAMCTWPANLRSAEPPARLAVDVSVCEVGSVDSAALREQVELELAGLGVSTTGLDGAAPADRIALEVGCAGPPGSALLTLHRGDSGRSAESRIALADVSEHLHVRTIAIAVAELVDLRWRELGSQRSPARADAPVRADEARTPSEPEAEPPKALGPAGARASEDRGDAASEPAPDRPPPRSHVLSESSEKPQDASDHRLWGSPRVAVAGFGALFVFPAYDTILAGPGLSAWVSAGRLRLSVGGDVAFGSAEVGAGRLDTRWVTAFVGAGVETAGDPRLALEPRLYLGQASGEGEPGDATVAGLVQSRLVAAGSLAALLRARVVEPLHLAVAIEVGSAFHGVTFATDDAPALGVTGLFVSSRLGVSLE